MKILQLIQKGQLRGAEIFAAQLSEQLSAMGHEVLLVSLFEGTASLPFSGTQFCLKADPTKRFLDWRAWKNLAKLIVDFEPDIVQANAGDTLKYAANSRFLFRWKSKLIFRNANLISGFVKGISTRFYNQLLLTQIDGVASVSTLCAQDFVRTFSFAKSKVGVLPIGVLPVSQQLGLPEDLRVCLESRDFLIHIGSFVPEKNHEDLFNIFDRVSSKYPDLKLVLIGEGPLKERYQNQFSRRSELVFAGSRTDVAAIFPYAKALLLPSKIEGLPGVILEAMNNLVPVVSYDVGGISEVVSNCKTGWLVPKADTGSFVAAVNEVLELSDEKKNMLLDTAKRVVEEKYTVTALAKRFGDFYEEISKGVN